MIRIKEPKRTVTKVGGRRQGKSPMEVYYAAPYALTRKVIPEVMYGDEPVTKSPKRRVTKSAKKVVKKKARKAVALVETPAPTGVWITTAANAGRPKVHATAADRQRAYRERQKVKA